MAEDFYTRKLREYTFPVWEGEKFVPEAVIWDQMAIDGYRLRRLDKVIYLCEYQPAHQVGAFILFPIGWLLSLRRSKQISRYCNA